LFVAADPFFIAPWTAPEWRRSCRAKTFVCRSNCGERAAQSHAIAFDEIMRLQSNGLSSSSAHPNPVPNSSVQTSGPYENAAESLAMIEGCKRMLDSFFPLGMGKIAPERNAAASQPSGKPLTFRRSSRSFD
jgi:hypothetical protein